jgi:2-iminobutanoate/2-iminopropanoate deaminase
MVLSLELRYGDYSAVSNDRGNIVGLGDMEAQMRQAYVNIQRVLAQYGADKNMAFAAADKCKQDIFSGTPVVASTIVQIQRPAFPELMIEIRYVAKVETLQNAYRIYYQ